MEERIVSAANKVIFTRYGSGVELIVPCIRHGDETFWSIVDSFDHTKSMEDVDEGWGEVVQGFVTNKYRFVDRKEAWIIAEKQGQIIRDKDKCVGNLYSEHLY